MSGTKWTPGPWIKVDRSKFRADTSEPKWEIDQASGQRQNWIALVFDEADAELAAAAPDLYAALSRMAECFGHSFTCASQEVGTCDCGMDAANAALAKARGEA